MNMPAAQCLFHRAILQSAALGRGDRAPEQVSEIGRRFARALGLDPLDRQGFQEASVGSLLVAQREVALYFQVPLGMSKLPFIPVLDGVTVFDDSRSWFVGGSRSSALLVGFNAQEMGAAVWSRRYWPRPAPRCCSP